MGLQVLMLCQRFEKNRTKNTPHGDLGCAEGYHIDSEKDERCNQPMVGNPLQTTLHVDTESMSSSNI